MGRRDAVRVWLVVATASAAGCGRLGYAPNANGFDAHTPSADAGVTPGVEGGMTADAGASLLDASIEGGPAISDGSSTTVSDGGGILPDGGSVSADGGVVAGCGDGTCSIAAGEYCNACPADCATVMPVCGNGICDESEDGTSCFDDCGPTVWPPASRTIESDILDMVNAHRAAGTRCPGETGPMRPPVPALIRVTDLEALSRNLAWDYFHRAYSGERCAGVNIFDLIRAAGHDGPRGAGHSHVIPPSTTTAVDFYMADTDLCPALMDARYIVAGTGFVGDASEAWYVITFADR